MPINPLADDNTDENTPKRNTNVISSGANVNVTGTNPGSAARGPAAGANTNQPTGFTNLNQYVEANKDQGAGVGQKIAENVRGQANQGLQGLSQSGQEFNKALEGEGAKAADYSDQNVYNKVKSAVTDSSTPSDALVADFGKVRKQASDFAAGSDAGPKTLSDLDSYNTAHTQLANAQEAAKSTDTEAGRQTILQQQYKKPGYSSGQQNLDQLLSQNTPGGRDTLTGLRNNLLGSTGLATQESQAIQNAAQKRQQVSDETQKAAGSINNVLNGPTDTNVTAPAGVQYGVLGAYQKGLQALPGQLNTTQAANVQANLTKVSDWIKQNYGNNLFGKTADQLAAEIVGTSSPTGAATLGNSVTSQQYNQLGTLNQLAGNTGANQYSLGNGTTANSPDAATAFNSDAALNFGAGNNDLSSVVNNFKTDAVNQANQALNNSQFSAYGRTLNGPEGVDYVTNRVNAGMTNPQADSVENNKVATSLLGQLDTINASRNQMGLPPVGVDPSLVNYHTNSIATGILNQSGAPQSLYADPFHAFDTDFRAAINAAATVRAVYQTLQGIRDNPLQGAATSLGQGFSATNQAAPTVNPFGNS